MIFPGGDSGERPRDEGENVRSGAQYGSPASGAHEAPPIERMQQPAYGTPPPPDYGQQPHYPGAYAPPGYPQYAGYGPPPPAATNKMAIASLAVSIAGLLCGVGSVIGIVLGFIARSQIRQTPQPGYGLAVSGIVVGVASLVISLIWMIYAVR